MTTRRDFFKGLLALGVAASVAEDILKESWFPEAETPRLSSTQRMSVLGDDPYWFLRDITVAACVNEQSYIGDVRIHRGKDRFAFLLSLPLNSMGGLSRWVSGPNGMIAVPEKQTLDISTTIDVAVTVMLSRGTVASAAQFILQANDTLILGDHNDREGKVSQSLSFRDVETGGRSGQSNPLLAAGTAREREEDA